MPPRGRQTRSQPHLLCLLGLSLVVATGCLGPRRDSYLTSRPIVVADEFQAADSIWESAQDVLRRHNFRLDRVDRRAGVITTLPTISQHFFELWRHDVNTREDFGEATINPIRRWVEVVFARGDDGKWNRLTVTVHKERLSAPDRQFNSTGAAYQYFGYNLPSTTGIVRVTPEMERWIRSGDDPAMGEYLLGLIASTKHVKAALATNPAPSD